MKLQDRTQCRYTGIYKIENLITHEVYIGQAKNIYLRITQHLHSSVSEKRSDYNYPLHRAFRKYGTDNFDLEILELCSYEELNSAEMFWVTKYDAYKSGYNQTKGGNQSIRYIKLTEEQVVEIKNLLASTTKTYKEIADMYCVCSDIINRINSGRVWHNDAIKYPIRNAKAAEVKYRFEGTCVLQLDKKTGILINRYPTRKIASIALGSETYAPHIGSAITGKRESAYGYKWALEEISKEDWLKLLAKYVQ